MGDIPQLPKELYKIRDAVIEVAYKNEEPSNDLELLQNWLENDGWDALVGSSANETMAVDLNQLAYTSFNDDEYVNGWLGEEQQITDEMRVAHARMLIEKAGEGDDGYLCPSVYSVNITDESGRTAVIACIMHMMGQGGPETSWWGVYKTHDDFLEDLMSAGLVPVEFIKNLTNSEVLSHWQK